ncbi:MAG TPA: sugar ABC transporter permease [Fimbriimonas sp.]|nr:sugar ABC transporter permease [Fimbriimonas sp.]
MKARRSKESIAGVLFALPWLIGFTVFMLYPVCASIYYSFCEYSVLKPPIYVGFENYVDLFHDDIFRKSLWNTFFYVIISVPLSTIITIGLALLLNAKIRGQAFYRTFFYLPSLVPQTALACLWLWVFNSEHGLLNMGLEKLSGHFWIFHWHISGPPWLSDTTWSKPALIFMALWTGGNAMVIYLAGLQDVPVELLEASDLDGASPSAKLRHVTIPMISPVILFNVIMAMIGAFQIFAVPYIMFPNGQPAQSTYFYVMYLFDTAIVYHKMGYACAMGWIMFILIFVMTLLSLKVSEKRVYYSGG